MSVETLAELCIVDVVDNFETNGAVICTRDIGDQACTDIIKRLYRAKIIDDDIVDRLQVNDIETLNFVEFDPNAWSDKMSRWLADVVAAGLEVMTIYCKDFDGTIAKAIVEKYKKKKAATTSRNSSSEVEEQQRSVVEPALRTLSIHNYSKKDKKGESFDHLPRMLPIFAGTLKNLRISYDRYRAPTQESHRLLNVVGMLCLDKLSLYRFPLHEIQSVAVAPSMQNLKTLDLDGIRGLIDTHVLSFLEVAGKNIQHLRISSCNKLTDSTLQNIQLYCPDLVSLNLGGFNNLTTAKLEQFFETVSLTKLQRLELRDIDAFTDVVAAKIAAATVSGQLLYIHVCWCCEITKELFPVLANMPKLKYLELRCCNMLEDKDVDDFKTRQGLKDCREYKCPCPHNW